MLQSSIDSDICTANSELFQRLLIDGFKFLNEKLDQFKYLYQVAFGSNSLEQVAIDSDIYNG